MIFEAVAGVARENLPPSGWPANGLPRLARRHFGGPWGIEDRMHWVGDMDFEEDSSQARTAAGPRIVASLRNLVITIWRLAAAASTAAALRYHAPRPGRPLQTIMKC